MKLDAISAPYKKGTYKTKSGNVPAQSRQTLKQSIQDLEFVLDVAPAAVDRVEPAVKNVATSGTQYADDLRQINPEDPRANITNVEKTTGRSRRSKRRT